MSRFSFGRENTWVVHSSGCFHSRISSHKRRSSTLAWLFGGGENASPSSRIHTWQPHTQEVPQGHRRFASIETQFIKGWENRGTANTKLLRLFAVYNPDFFQRSPSPPVAHPLAFCFSGWFRRRPFRSLWSYLGSVVHAVRQLLHMFWALFRCPIVR